MLVKVGINEAFQQILVTNSFDRGRLFHLITDYEYYSGFFDPESIQDMTTDEFHKKVYHDYQVLNEYLKERYQIVFPSIAIGCDFSADGELKLLTKKGVDEFIKEMGAFEFGSHDRAN